jgi:metallo-beta-lactamase family protein
MRLSIHGAAREVTGSSHLVDYGSGRVLLDCGMIQGGAERHDRNREPFPFDADALSGVVLSHAHIDHSGRLPLLCRRGFAGPILATGPTVELCKILLADSARIHEEDARWKIKRLRKRGEDASWVRPLYTSEDVDCILDLFVAVPFDEPRELAGGARVTFTRAGHILGAAIVGLELPRPGQPPLRLAFSGDLGTVGARLVGGPAPIPCPDHLLIESTYGDRTRDRSADRTEQLHAVIDAAARRGGKVVIPTFAVGRTQAVLARLNDLVEAGRLPGLPVFVDSPMAAAATRVFAIHPEAWSEEARRLLQRGDPPLEFPGLRFTRSVEESKEINDIPGPCVILSASGMATAGRVKHHLSHTISDARNTVLFVGYQAAGSLGRLIQDGTDPVRIFGEWHPVRARVETIEGFSAHADQAELLDWFASLGGVPRRTYVVHGEEQAALTLASLLGRRFGAAVEVPRLGQSWELD